MCIIYIDFRLYAVNINFQYRRDMKLPYKHIQIGGRKANEYIITSTISYSHSIYLQLSTRVIVFSPLHRAEN